HGRAELLDLLVDLADALRVVLDGLHALGGEGGEHYVGRHREAPPSVCCRALPRTFAAGCTGSGGAVWPGARGGRDPPTFARQPRASLSRRLLEAVSSEASSSRGSTGARSRRAPAESTVSGRPRAGRSGPSRSPCSFQILRSLPGRCPSGSSH